MVSCARPTRHTGTIGFLHCGRCSSRRARLRPLGLPSKRTHERAWMDHLDIAIVSVNVASTASGSNFMAKVLTSLLLSERIQADFSALPCATGTKRISRRCFKTEAIRFSITRECPSYSASSSRQIAEAVVPTLLANCRCVRPAFRRRAVSFRPTLSFARAS